MNISFEGIGHISVTFPAGASCAAGKVGKLDSDGKIAACAAGDKFCGMVEAVSGSYAGVQLHGFVTAAYTGTAPTVGYAALSANGTGGVKVDTNGKSYLVVEVNTTASTVTFEL